MTLECSGPGDNGHASAQPKLCSASDKPISVAPATCWDGALLTKTEALHARIKSELMASIAGELIRCDIDPSAIDFDLEQVLDLPDDIKAEIDYLSRMFTAHILRKHVGKQEPIPSLTSRQAELVTTYIQGHLCSNVTINDLCGLVAMSPTVFNGRFRATFRLTPHQYVVEERVKQARLLLQSDMPLTEVAYACGFADQSHLSRTFKRLVGISPASYRRMTA